jgi:FkbM family methyltransferase
MTGIIHKSKTAITRPEELLPFLREGTTALARLLRSGNYVAAVLFLLSGITERDLTRGAYTRYLRWRYDGDYVTRDVHGSTMVLDIEDEGINRDLLLYGTREELSTEQFAGALRSFADVVDGPITVLDVGANIGYFAFLEAAILGERANVHAFEPHPENVEQLERGVALNGYGSVIDVEPYALGEQTGTADLQISDVSNRHRIDGLPGLDDDANTITVDVDTVDGFLDERGVGDDPVVVRIDVEGGEHTVFQGMERLLASDGPALAFVELHRGLTDEMARDILSALDEGGFVPRYTSDGWGTESIDVERFEDLLPVDSNTHVMATRW